jgi:hypothetical protein
VNEGWIEISDSVCKLGYTKSELFMAKGGNSLTHGMKGRVGKAVVFKQYKDYTVMAAYPDMSNIKPSKEQKAQRSEFSLAVAFAKKILAHPFLKMEYEKKRGKKKQKLYHFLIKEYFKMSLIERKAAMSKSK